MQLLGCRAQLQATKQSFLLLSRAFTAWQQMVELRKQLEVVTDTLQVRRLTGGGWTGGWRVLQPHCLRVVRTINSRSLA